MLEPDKNIRVTPYLMNLPIAKEGSDPDFVGRYIDLCRVMITRIVY